MNRRLLRAAGVSLLAVGGALAPPMPPSLVHAQPAAASRRAFAAARFAVSPRLRDLPPEPRFRPEDVVDDVRVRPPKLFRVEAAGVAPSVDAARQASMPEVALPAPSVSFDGISSEDNGTLFGVRVSPPDTNGDVGPNHYVEIVNLAYRVYDKSGHPLTPARKLSTLFAALGGPCANRDDGDPVVLYDPLADRWLLSQFCTVATPNNHELVAISRTGDPTGDYFLYDFMMPNDKFNDYPKFGVWPDAYYMTDNQYNQAGTAFQGAGVFAFDRAKMLAGDPAASFIYFDLAASPSTASAGGVLPADLDGLDPPPPGTPGYFSYFTADEFGDPADALRVFELRADFAHPSHSTFTERPESPIAVAAFNPLNPLGRDDIEQPPPAITASESLDSISDRLMFRLAYRNFGDHESLVVDHTVNVGTGNTIATHQAGVRYYELRRTLPGGAFAVAEQATFAPDAANRWMGSAAMDHQGDVAVGYSVSSSSIFPSVRYAGRLASDPAGGLFQGETTLVAGSGVQTSTASRWGDYSALSVDPADDCTFWYAQEYYTAASQATSTVGWLTRIGAFKFPSCLPAGRGTVQGVVTNAATGLPIVGAVVQTASGYSRITDGAGQYSMTVPPGTYDVTAFKPDHLTGVASVVVASGGTIVQNFSLNPLPVLSATGAVTMASESCSPATGAVDPGETVSVELAIRNTGAGDTVNLVGTLLATGGVIAPGSPQTYGVVPAGGAPVTRTFTFTAEPALACGAMLTATLGLQDNVNDLGTLTYAFTLGRLGAGTFAVTYGTGNVAIPIPDAGGVTVPITVPSGADVISDVKLRVRLNHTFDGDLVMAVVHPDGTSVPLASNRGGAGDNYGAGPDDCSGTPTVFDDAASTAIWAGVAPFAGSFRPESPLSVLSGKPSAGTWKVVVSDTAPVDVGVIGCAQLEISRRTFLCCPFAGPPAVGAAPPALVVAESCQPANGAIDPDETVTVSFPLQNVGTSPTANVVATLLPGGGVNAPSGPQSYGALGPVDPPVARTFSFVPSGACGGTFTAALALVDEGGAGPLGTTTFTLDLGATTSAVFANPAPIQIPARGTGASDGAPAAPYPSTIEVSGVPGKVGKVTVTLSGLSHSFPADVDVLLVAPSGQSLLLMSDVGGGTDVADATLIFDDTAAPMGSRVTSGTFAPTNVDPGDAFPAPAPPGPYPDPQRLSVFNGIDPNGTWKLFVVDDSRRDTGRIAGGWSLRITTAAVCCDQP